MAVQVAADVVDGDQLGQRADFRRRHLAAVLAHLRRNESEAELVVDILLGRAGDAAAAGEQPVFVELPLARIGEAAQRDVVRLGTGEIEERGAIARFSGTARISTWMPERRTTAVRVAPCASTSATLS